MNVSISPDNQEFVAASLRSGRYVDSSALLNEAIELLKRRDEILAAVDAGVDQLDRGDVVEGDDLFDRLNRKFDIQSQTGAE